jgi:signal transduction histidine kinase
MQSASRRMQTLIQDLLAYSRTNTLERKFEKTSLNEIVEEVKEDLVEELLNKHAIIETGELGSANIIPLQFRQLMFNLINNALKFSADDRRPHVKIESEIAKGKQLDHPKLVPEQAYCHIRIADNGIGFESEYSDKIFEVFQRLHGKDKYKGTGIGLAIVKKIVENHHGVIAANSRLGLGATFDIYLPA